MKTITVAELRQNPTQALADVEAGESYVVTKHRRPVARLAPLGNEATEIIAPRNPGPVVYADWPTRRTYARTDSDELVAWVKGDR